MISGSFPCCNAPLLIEMPSGGPFYAEEACPACGAKVWHRFSRVVPQSWLESDFLAEHTVDPVTRAVAEINPPPPETEQMMALRERFAGALHAAMESRIIDGEAEPKGTEHFQNDFAGFVISRLVEAYISRMFQTTEHGILAQNGMLSGGPISGKSFTAMLVDEVFPLPDRETAVIGVDMGGRETFSMGSATVYLDGERIGSTVERLGRGNGKPYGSAAALMEVVEIRMQRALTGIESKLLATPEEPFHYSQLNPVSRNARRGRKRNR